MFLAAGEGLAAAHHAGIHHRDFKPSNVMIGDDGRVVVVDFGVAASLHSSPERDELGRPGTPSYMAPERLRGKQGDERSDQFSFCASMWRGLFEQRPFAGETTEELVAAIERGEPLEAPGVDVPRWLIEVVRKGLAYNPAERHRDMPALLVALIDGPPPDDGDAAGGDDGVAGDGGVAGDDGDVVAGDDGDVAGRGGDVAGDGGDVAGDDGDVAGDDGDVAGDDGVVAGDDGVVVGDGGVVVGDGDVPFVEGRALHEPPRAVSRRERWLYVVIAFLVAGVLVLGMWSPSTERPASDAVAVEPYPALLGLIATDDFEKALQVWLEYKSEWTDEQLLVAADECLRRAKRLELVDTAKAEVAALAALKIANELQYYGSTPEAKREGGRLASDANPSQALTCSTVSISVQVPSPEQHKSSSSGPVRRQHAPAEAEVADARERLIANDHPRRGRFAVLAVIPQRPRRRAAALAIRQRARGIVAADRAADVELEQRSLRPRLRAKARPGLPDRVRVRLPVVVDVHVGAQIGVSGEDGGGEND